MQTESPKEEKVVAQVTEAPVIGDQTAIGYFYDTTVGTFNVVTIKYDSKTMKIESINKKDLNTNMKEEALTKFKVALYENQLI